MKADITSGKTKMLYVAPETLKKEENLEFFRGIKVSFIAVDEAHCISEWGHDFRPEYRQIKTMIGQIDAKIPIIALTATATPKVQSDIKRTSTSKTPTSSCRRSTALTSTMRSAPNAAASRPSSRSSSTYRSIPINRVLYIV